jgi:hypothetical protein
MTSLETAQSRDSGARSPTFEALGHAFAVVSHDEVAALAVDEAFAALAVASEARDVYSVRRMDGCFTVERDGRVLEQVGNLAGVVDCLRRDVTRRAITAADADLVLHAGAVRIDQRAVLLSSPAHGGMSTLVAALVAEGCGYLADGAVAVRLHDGRVRPFPQPLALDDRALDMLPEVPALRLGRTETADGARLVALRSGASCDSTLQVAMVAFLEPETSGLTVVQPVSSGDAVVRLGERCFNFPRHGAAAIETLTRLVRDANRIAVVGGDPRSSACALLDAVPA